VRATLLLLPVLWCAAAGAQAAAPTVAVSNDLLVQDNQLAHGPGFPDDPKTRPSQYQEALSVVWTEGSWLGGFTLRQVNFYQAQANETLPSPDASLYRVYGTFTARDLSATAGDFNAVLGRGLVLSVVKNDAVLQDWTIRGAQVKERWGPLDLRAMAGTVSNNLRRLDDFHQRWKVSGLEGELEWAPGNRLGARAVTIEDDTVPPDLSGQRVGRRAAQSMDLAGANLFDRVDYYGEIAQVRYLDPMDVQIPSPATDPARGSGAYGTLIFHAGPWLLQGEVKRYRHFDDELNNPPLADRDSEPNNKANGDGARLYGQYSFRRPDLTLFLSGGRYREGNLIAPVSFRGSNVYGGFKGQDWMDFLDLSCTYGLKTVHEAGTYPEWKTDAAMTCRFGQGWGADFTFTEVRNHIPGSDPYEQWDLTSQLTRSPWGAVYLTQQYDPLVNTAANPFGTSHLYSAGVRVTLRNGSFIDFSGGRLRGGQVCAGGQCILLPAYQGWKLVTHFRI
jgi:hypothetical protein